MYNTSNHFMALPSQLATFSDREAHLTVQVLRGRNTKFTICQMKILVGSRLTKNDKFLIS